MEKYEQLLTSVGRQVKEVREHFGKTQKELGELSDSKRTYITELENGKRNIGLKKLWRIAEAMDAEVVVIIKRK